ncbi:MAG: class I SAM-dependent rRNA methyltransferase [Bacteroidota bacterium]
MTDLPRIILANKKQGSLLRFHPWVFSGAIKKIEGDPKDGDIVEVYSVSSEYLATGHFQADGSIAVRAFSFKRINPDGDFWKEKIRNAYETRLTEGLADNTATNIYRLVHAEGDGLPGLIIDVYADTAVIQCHSIGMYMIKDHLVEALRACYGDQLKTIYDKSSETLPKNFAANLTNQCIWGEDKGSVIGVENGCKYNVDWFTGQKTGFFIDQRENRKLLGEYSKGKKVLNTFCYSGGFSIAALLNGAKEVHSLDSSARALDLVTQNLELNGLQDANHKNIKADAVEYIREIDVDYDVIVLDPPAFAKHMSARHNAVQGYKRLNAQAIKSIKPGGLIFTFSCSQVVDKYMFNSTVMAAAIEAGREVRILHQLHQPADHPVNIFHPESEYLKGLVIQVN